jgi:ribosome-binding protein aMBF1 (putative translation factor)
MKEAVQIIEKDGIPEWAVIPFALYQKLREKADLSDDAATRGAGTKRLDARKNPLPTKVKQRLSKGENPVRVWRDHRGITQQTLSSRVGISAAFLSQIESGKRIGSAGVLKNLAKALQVDMDDLV